MVSASRPPGNRWGTVSCRGTILKKNTAAPINRATELTISKSLLEGVRVRWGHRTKPVIKATAGIPTHVVKVKAVNVRRLIGNSRDNTPAPAPS
ncbi:hypothetical protein GCM10009116_10110 [Brevundimonas basaltis]